MVLQSGPEGSWHGVRKNESFQAKPNSFLAPTTQSIELHGPPPAASMASSLPPASSVPAAPPPEPARPGAPLVASAPPPEGPAPEIPEPAWLVPPFPLAPATAVSIASSDEHPGPTAMAAQTRTHGPSFVTRLR